MQILLNFMSNAVKFTPMYGEIKIEADLQDIYEVPPKQDSDYEIIRNNTVTLISKVNSGSI
jgi:signal transduction histidine kinase